MSSDALTREYMPKYRAGGEQKLYRLLLAMAVNKLTMTERGIYRGPSPEIEYLENHDQFIILHRREGDEVYLQMARVFRRAAHKIYRMMLKKKMTAPNAKFLNLV